jgi:hypothetical protein
MCTVSLENELGLSTVSKATKSRFVSVYTQVNRPGTVRSVASADGAGIVASAMILPADRFKGFILFFLFVAWLSCDEAKDKIRVTTYTREGYEQNR